MEHARFHISRLCGRYGSVLSLMNVTAMEGMAAANVHGDHTAGRFCPEGAATAATARTVALVEAEAARKREGFAVWCFAMPVCSAASIPCTRTVRACGCSYVHVYVRFVPVYDCAYARVCTYGGDCKGREGLYVHYTSEFAQACARVDLCAHFRVHACLQVVCVCVCVCVCAANVLQKRELMLHHA
jgi:hypothetical protein